VIAVLFLSLAAPLLAPEQDWPEFRGPGGQGHSNEAGLPTVWSEANSILWKTRVPGLGWSSPVVAGGRVWLEARDEIRADDRNSTGGHAGCRLRRGWRRG